MAHSLHYAELYEISRWFTQCIRSSESPYGFLRRRGVYLDWHKRVQAVSGEPGMGACQNGGSVKMARMTKWRALLTHRDLRFFIAKLKGHDDMMTQNSKIFKLLLIVAVFTPGLWCSGEDSFKVCAACHSIGEGPRVGPDLKGITARRSMAWIMKFVKSSQTLIKSGDPEAVAVFKKFNNIPMPDMPLSDAQIQEVMEYIDSKSGGSKSAPAPKVVRPITDEEIILGQDLFEGKTRLTNRGPACNSCHHVRNDAVIGGGILAAELTEVFTKVSGEGVRAILDRPPFPVMNQAYKGKELTKDEVHALTGFLEFADKAYKKNIYQPADYGIKLAVAGGFGVIILLLFYAFLWNLRKQGSVNQAIYDRQVKSE